MATHMSACGTHRYILTWLPELRPVAKLFDNDRRNVLEPWRLAPGYIRKHEIDVTPRRDSPLWIMSVNRVHWPEYQKMMSGRAFTLTYKPHSPNCIHEELCRYVAPVVPPIELEIIPDKIPVDHSWGLSDRRSSHNKKNGRCIRTADSGHGQPGAKIGLRENQRGKQEQKPHSSGGSVGQDLGLATATASRTSVSRASSTPNPTDNPSAQSRRKPKPRRSGSRVQSGPLANEQVPDSSRSRLVSNGAFQPTTTDDRARVYR